MLQGLAPSEERNEKLDVKVFDFNNPDDLTHEGALDVNYRYIGAYKVKVPADSFDAVLMKWTFKGKIGPASVNETSTAFSLRMSALWRRSSNWTSQPCSFTTVKRKWRGCW